MCVPKYIENNIQFKCVKKIIILNFMILTLHITRYLEINLIVNYNISQEYIHISTSIEID